MQVDLDIQLEQVNERITRKKELQASLPEAREIFGRENYHLMMLVAALEQAQSEIDALESLTLQSLLDSVMGRKDKKLAQWQKDVDAVQAEFEECTDRLKEIQGGIESIENELAGMGKVEDEFQRVLGLMQVQIMDDGGETGLRLRNLLGEQDQTESRLRNLTKTIDLGEIVVERLQSMTGSLGRGTSKHVGYLLGGLLIGSAISALGSTRAKGAVDWVGAALDEFGENLNRLEFDPHTERGVELSRLSALITVSSRELSQQWRRGLRCDMTVTQSFLENVSSMLGHLKSMCEEQDEQRHELEEQRRALVLDH